jgi:hypothetical protein
VCKVSVLLGCDAASQSTLFWTVRPLKMRQMRSLKTSGTKYHVTQHHIRDEMILHRNCYSNVGRSCCHAFPKSSSNFFQQLGPWNGWDIRISVSPVCLTVDLFERHFPLQWLSSESIFRLLLSFSSVFYISVHYSHLYFKLLPLLTHPCASILLQLPWHDYVLLSSLLALCHPKIFVWFS